MPARLVMKFGPMKGKVFPLDGDNITVGREVGNTIIIEDKELSRHHARILLSNGVYSIEDTGSTNGTFINEQRVTTAAPLRSGDVIALGEVTFLFEIINLDPKATAVSLKRAEVRSSLEQKAAREKKRPKPGGIGISGEDVDIGADVVGGDKVVSNVYNYYQSPSGGKKTPLAKEIARFLARAAKSWLIWAALAVIILGVVGWAWYQQQPVSVAGCKSEGNYIILVGQFEALGVAERPVGRFIVDDLKQKLVTGLPPVNFIVCEYPRALKNDAEALAAAQANQADVVVWGNYTANFIEAAIQVGDTSSLVIPQEVLAKTANVRVRMTDERQDSISRHVLAVFDIIFMGRGGVYEFMQGSVKVFPIPPTNVQVISTGVSRYTYEFTNLFTSDTEQALEQVNQGLEMDAGNPILLILQSGALQRLGKFNEAMDSAEAASRLGPANWPPPFFMKANRGLFTGNYDEAINYYSQFIAVRADDWFPYTMRGYLWLMKGDLAQAKADIDKSLSLQPAENWPFTWAVSIALRQGRLAEVKQYVAEAMTRFPDAEAGEKAAEIIAAQEINPFTPALSAFWSMNQGLFNKAIQKAEMATLIDPKFTDAYLIAGLSYCNLDKLPEAEAAYTQALTLEPNFTLLYLLRAGTRQGQGNLNGAMSDLGMVQTSPQAGQLNEYVQAAMQGKLSCKNALTYTP